MSTDAFKLNNLRSVSLFSLPFGQRPISNSNRGDENLRSVNLPNNELIRISLNAVEYTAFELNFRWPLYEHFSVHKSPHNAHSRNSVHTESRANGPRISDSGKHVFRVFPDLRPAESIQRQIEQPSLQGRLTRALVGTV